MRVKRYEKTEVLDSVFHPVESRFSGFQVIPHSLSVKLGLRIPIIYGILGPLTCTWIAKHRILVK